MQHAVVSKRGLSVSRCILKLRIRKQLHKSATRGKVHYRRNIPSRLFGANHDLVHRRTEYYSTTATHEKNRRLHYIWHMPPLQIHRLQKYRIQDHPVDTALEC